MSTALADAPAGSPVDFFRREGYLVVRGVVDPADVAELASECDHLLKSDLVYSDNMRCRWRENIDTGAEVFDLFEPVLDVAPKLGRHINNPAILSLLEGLLGEPVVHFREKLIYKLPRATGVKLHQDWHSWEKQPLSFMTVAIAIDSHDDETGCVEVFPRMHEKWLGPPDTWYFMDEQQVAGAESVKILLDPGDIVVFGPMIPHRSAPNMTRDRTRRGLFACYVAASEGEGLREKTYKNYLEYRLTHRFEKGKPNLKFS